MPEVVAAKVGEKAGAVGISENEWIVRAITLALGTGDIIGIPRHGSLVSETISQPDIPVLSDMPEPGAEDELAALEEAGLLKRAEARAVEPLDIYRPNPQGGDTDEQCEEYCLTVLEMGRTEAGYAQLGPIQRADYAELKKGRRNIFEKRGS